MENEEKDAALYGPNSMKSHINDQMKNEYLREKKSKSASKPKKLVKPHMNEKSEQRFQIFKEEIRKELHDSDEYMFSQKYMEANGNALLNVKRSSGTISTNLSNSDETQINAMK